MKTSRPILRMLDANLDADPAPAHTPTLPMPVLTIVPRQAEEPPTLARSSSPELIGIPTADAQPGRSLAGRVFALLVLVATAGGLSWVGVQIYHVVTDGWIAPLHLSPDNDQIQNLRLSHQRHLDELARIDAEVARIDGELHAIDTAIVKLKSLRGTSTETRRWQAEQARAEVSGLASAQTLLRRQLAQLREVHARQTALVERARGDLAAGLVDRTALDREEQTRDQIALQMIDIERQLGETHRRREQSSVALEAYRAGIGAGKAPAIGRMPEIAAGDERDLRIEVELLRLEAEARGHRALRAVAIESLARERHLLKELEARPLHRAMKAATDVGFVPYDQLGAVVPGARVMACTWGVFACSQVGVVKEVLPGEVVTQDPWGEMARGQYIVLALDDKDAVQQRVLRVRR
ncbi:MAG: hypothetical protein KF773_16205 [Deltaproteobacteria bacterium]|nr:hypothetical protein [Deltaproteobacteria bacterium]MCW5801807.1 hypothetical protein [Deltaproteobacteria bacterium]